MIFDTEVGSSAYVYGVVVFVIGVGRVLLIAQTITAIRAGWPNTLDMVYIS